MLYGKDAEKKCAHCLHMRRINETDGLCDKKGPVALSFSCGRFKYDPLQRVPPRPARLVTPEAEELSL